MIFAILIGPSAVAQTNFYTILTNGPASNRLNMVFLAEGYTAAQYPQFLATVTNTLQIFFSTSPFAEYQNHFNCFAIAVPSAQSGSDHPVYPQFVSTYFNSTYGTSDYLITIPPNAYDANPANGRGKITSLLNTYLPECDLPVLLVNDNSIGGSDGGGTLAISSVSPNSLFYVPLHESGHVLAGLGDEYTTANPGFPDVEEPNTTRETNRAAIKWNAWISAETPIPTPAAAPFTDTVGLFAGAHYHETGWYRPKLNCLMKSAGSPFCEVCREALVLAIYRQARPVDSFMPAITNLTAESDEPISFSLSLLQPTEHSLTVQWLTNGVPVSAATNVFLAISPALLANGTNTISAHVMDPTFMVRTDPENQLIQTVNWRVTVQRPHLLLSNPRWLPAAGFAFTVGGDAPQGFSIQASTDFVSWDSLMTNSLTAGVFNFTNSGSEISWRAFRAVTPPQ